MATDPDPNLYLSVRDQHTLINQLEQRVRHLVALRGTKIEARYLRKLIARLYAIQWAPPVPPRRRRKEVGRGAA